MKLKLYNNTEIDVFSVTIDLPLEETIPSHRSESNEFGEDGSFIKASGEISLAMINVHLKDGLFLCKEDARYICINGEYQFDPTDIIGKVVAVRNNGITAILFDNDILYNFENSTVKCMYILDHKNLIQEVWFEIIIRSAKEFDKNSYNSVQGNTNKNIITENNDFNSHAYHAYMDGKPSTFN